MDKQKVAAQLVKLAKALMASEEEVKTASKEEYMKYFQKKLDKYNVSSPSELDAETKKKFFDEVDAGYEAENEAD